MKTTWTIATIKADPGYLIVYLPEPDKLDEPFTETYYEPVIAWEIQRFEEFTPPYQEGDWPDRIRTDIVAIGDSGGRSDNPLAGPVGVKRPDDSCYDIDGMPYDNEQHMLRSLRAERAKASE
jgi:hypothetical protein